MSPTKQGPLFQPKPPPKMAEPMPSCRICGKQAPYGFSFDHWGNAVYEYYCIEHRHVGEDRLRRS